MIFVKVGGFGSKEVMAAGYDDGKWFAVDSFSFGVDRVLKETGEKGGTEDINIGVGELRPIVVTKRLDDVSGRLAQTAINGNSVGTAEFDFVTMDAGAGKPVVYLKYKLARCFVTSWSTSGDADNPPSEEVAFYYNKIAFQYRAPGASSPSDAMSWDHVKNVKWSNHGIKWPAALKRTSRRG